MKKHRQDHEQPLATGEWGWRYHHVGIPTTDPSCSEKYHSPLKFFTSGFGDSPYGVEWMRFEVESPIHELIKRVPHVAFEVDDLDMELSKHSFNVITAPNAPGAGVRVAMIEHNGVPIELIEFEKSNEE